MKSDVLVKNKILFIILTSLLLKFIILYLVNLFSDQFSLYFMNDGVFHDDNKYYLVGEYYLENSKILFDENFFSRATFNVGHNTQNSSENLRFWIVSLFSYTFRSAKILNYLVIFISSLNIYLIYIFGKKFFSLKTGLITASLYAFMPYSLIFSVFIFKDHLIITIVILILNLIASIFYNEKIRIVDIILGVLSIIFLNSLRAGLVNIIILFIIFSLFFRIFKKRNRMNLISLIIGSLAIFMFFFALSDLILENYDTAIYKLNSYVNANRFDNTSLSLIGMNSVLEIYKFPFAFSFSLIMPLNLNFNISSWLDIVSFINFISIPISAGTLIYLLFHKKRKPLIVLTILVLNIGSLFVSLAIFRHYYYLLPLNYLLFSEYIIEKKNNIVWILLTIIMSTSIMYFIYIN